MKAKCRKCGSTLEILDNDLPLMPPAQSLGMLKIQDKLPETQYINITGPGRFFRKMLERS
jgi:hypothetical protein